MNNESIFLFRRRYNRSKSFVPDSERIRLCKKKIVAKEIQNKSKIDREVKDEGKISLFIHVNWLLILQTYSLIQRTMYNPPSSPRD